MSMTPTTEEAKTKGLIFEELQRAHAAGIRACNWRLLSQPISMEILENYLPAAVTALAAPRTDSAERTAGEVKSFGKHESDALMQIIHALDDLAEPWLEGAQEASGTGEKDYERRDMLVHSVLTSAGNGLLGLLREHGPEGYFPRTESLKRDPNLLTAARDHIRGLERKLAAATPAPSSPGVPDSVREAMAELSSAVTDAHDDYMRLGDYDGWCRLNNAEERLRRLIDAISDHPAGQSDDGAERCIACDKPLKAGERVLSDAEGGTIHTACCGPEREGYTKGDGEPLGPNDPKPQGYVYEPELPAGQSTAPEPDPTLLYWVESNTERLCKLYPEAADSIAEFRDELLGLMEGGPAGQSTGQGAEVDGSVEVIERCVKLATDAGLDSVTITGSVRHWHDIIAKLRKPAPDSTRTGQVETDGIEAVTEVLWRSDNPAEDDVSWSNWIAYVEDHHYPVSLTKDIEHCRRRARVLIAAFPTLVARPAAPEAQGAWCFDMEAAPRDGAPLLCVEHDEPEKVVDLHWFRDSGTGSSWRGSFGQLRRPIAWRRLPAPPASAGQESAR